MSSSEKLLSEKRPGPSLGVDAAADKPGPSLGVDRAADSPGPSLGVDSAGDSPGPSLGVDGAGAATSTEADDPFITPRVTGDAPGFLLRNAAVFSLRRRCVLLFTLRMRRTIDDGSGCEDDPLSCGSSSISGSSPIPSFETSGSAGNPYAHSGIGSTSMAAASAASAAATAAVAAAPAAVASPK